MKTVNHIYILTLFFLLLTITSTAQSIEAWITTANREHLFEKQSQELVFNTENTDRHAAIIIDPNQKMQSIDGYGFALTGGSAQHLMNMDSGVREATLKNLFATNNSNIGISYIRLSLGASDLNSFVFSYDDIDPNETDFKLNHFSLSQDLNDVIPVMKEILKINPNIKIMASPWSAPSWMKTNKNIRGGKLKKDCYQVYAAYFVKYIQAMKKHGITIDAVTIQNEPMNSRNTPSMSWFWHEQAAFIKENLGPLFKKNGIDTKIVIFDHNGDRPDYPLSILKDYKTSQFIDGSGFHNYRGDMESMELVHLSRPDKSLYFTEQMVVEDPYSTEIRIAYNVNRLIIDPMRYWSKNVVLWNLAADPLNDPHTDNGGCSMCQGAITIDSNNTSKNIAYYTIAHASKFIRPGSFRIHSSNTNDKSIHLYQDEQRPEVFRAGLVQNTDLLPNVAFETPEDKIVLIVANNHWDTSSFKIQYQGKFVKINLSPGAVGTYIWNK
ncbi:glycoside hydrolase family 30 protein [Galbibacter orientalis]|uniref:glycoside hydrolase family 30 protein n=1 Tax=Galbibacter orientalis TaxID=453852 RepID=UPI00308002A1